MNQLEMMTINEPSTFKYDPMKERFDPVDPGLKYDDDKIRTDLYSVDAYLGTCDVLTYGVKKYSAWNWANGVQRMRVVGALLRHVFEWVRGIDIDPESGKHHLDHAGCCVMFLQHYAKHPEQYKQFDDRPQTYKGGA